MSPETSDMCGTKERESVLINPCLVRGTLMPWVRGGAFIGEYSVGIAGGAIQQPAKDTSYLYQKGKV